MPIIVTSGSAKKPHSSREGRAAESKNLLGRSFKKGQIKRALDRMKTSKPDKKSGSSTSDVFKSYDKYDGKPIKLAGGGIAKILGKKAVNWIKKNKKTIKKEVYSPEGKKKTQDLTKKLQEGLKRPGHTTGGRAIAGVGAKGGFRPLTKKSPDAKGGFRPITRRPTEKKKREKGLVIVKVGGSAEGFKDAKKIKGKPHSSPEGKFFSKLRTQPLKIKFNKGGRAKHNIGGRANLLEEMGRIDARRHPDAADRSEKRRVIGELNRGYKSGGAVLKGKKVGCQIK